MDNLFFKQRIPHSLKQLNNDTPPLWGRMNAQEMILHLQQALRLSRLDEPRTIVTPKDKLPALKAFLRSAKPMGKNLPAPSHFQSHKPKATHLIEGKVAFLEELNTTIEFFKENPQFTSIHENFGVLGVSEWALLHEKHFRHHFSQFGLEID